MATATVRREDQLRINEFGQNQSRLEEVELEVAALKRAVDAYEDVEVENMMAADDARRVLIGDAYFHLDDDDFDEIIEERTQKANEELEETSKELAVLSARQASLKDALYSRFGDNIQLER